MKRFASYARGGTDITGRGTKSSFGGYKRFAWNLRNWFDENVSPKKNGGGVEWQREVLWDLGAEVVDRTPVETGRARGSWLLTLNTPTKQYTRRDPTGDATIRAMLIVIQAMEDCEDAVLYSNCPYMGRLENGHSRQAPNGMLAGAIAAVIAKQKGPRHTREEWHAA